MNAERIIRRLERAGGELTECRQLLVREGTSGIPLATAINEVNIRLADLRRAAIRIESGEDPKYVVDEYRAKWAEEGS